MRQTIPVEPLASDPSISPKVGVFCGSRVGKHPQHLPAAEEFGRALGDRGVGLVYGAGSVGIMGTLAESAKAAGASVTGVIPRALYEREGPDPFRAKLIVTETMHERKALMYRLSSGFAVLPGGFGTMDELLEVATWNQLGFHDKPVVLVNCGRFFDTLLAFLDSMVAHGYLGLAERALIQVASDAHTALDLLGFPRLSERPSEVTEGLMPPIAEKDKRKDSVEVLQANLD
ncbi:LOG family protein [Amycolatopsis panacis]|uniref:Cytokinin riboside 5'-monophosphate phosphoribohydrolase n=1 Tax=Amycolatopsis panacis TaxID=2340917 RepID=A0A419IB52_9PSEU|nr:TIGR00730 family Rossman fold protein [Amycolatopsis panacis]RJQ91303.1 TIGR00730 family Rossman fold protein [Amycolatopsis panacis]